MLTDIKPSDIAAVDAWYWAHSNQIRLQGDTFSTVKHAYQVKWLQSRAKKKVYKKAAQMGASEAEVLNTLHDMIYGRYPKGVLYLFPTADDVGDFSKGRFNPLIADNLQTIGKYVQDTDTASVKKINRSVLYLRGARATQKVEGMKKDSSKLRSIPVDKVVEDERDLMEHEMVAMALVRMDHSDVKEEVVLSTPTIPDYGIDKEYQDSNQEIWVIKCPQCTKEVCLELEFPDCIQQWNDGTYKRGCPRCGHELNPATGQWVVRESGRATEGYFISQLNSTYVDPGSILKLYLDPPNGNLQEVMNSKLGMAYISAENRLTPQEVRRCMDNNLLPPLKHTGPTAMGVDVGNQFHITILDKPTEKELRIVKVLSVSSNKMDDFTPLHDIAVQYGVKSMVIDFAPVQHNVRAFREAEEFEVFGCIYQEHQRGPATWDAEQGVVRINRTEICDESHKVISTIGRLIMPRRNPDMDEYTTHCCNLAKVLEEDKDTGSKEFRYRKLGPDHYRHSLNYALLAAQRIGVYTPPSKEANSADAKIERKRSQGSWRSR